MGDVYVTVAGRPKCPTRRMPREDRADHLTVLLDGVKEVSTRPGSRVLDFFLSQGDFLKVVYPSRGGFNGVRAAEEVAWFARPYKVVTFVGVSAGGLLACDTIDVLHMEGLSKNRLIAVDAPFDSDDVTGRGARLLARFVPTATAMPHFMNQRVIGTRSRLEPEADLTQEELRLIETHHQRVANLPIGTLADRLRFLYRHVSPDRYTLADLPSFYLRSKNDPVVHDSAAKKWLSSCHKMRQYNTRTHGHAAMLEYPSLWLRAFEVAFASLSVRSPQE